MLKILKFCLKRIPVIFFNFLNNRVTLKTKNININMKKDYLELSDFDHKIYGSYDDLKTMNKQELEKHYFEFGIDEGRFYTGIQNSLDFVTSIKKGGKMLEIGPLDKPKLDYLSPEYYSLDVFNKEELIKNYIDNESVKKDKIIEPSYIIKNNDYSNIKEKFECIFSSHNIEHMPCVTTYLNNLEKVLQENGSIYLAIPDKRYCFDHFKKTTEIYDVLQLFNEKNNRPKFTDVLKMASQGTHNDSGRHWNNDHGIIDYCKLVIERYTPALTQFNTTNYVDAHVSCFTPKCFMEIIETLHELKLTNLHIHKIYHTLKGCNEFYVILKKTRTENLN